MSIKLKDTIYDLINNSNFSKQLKTPRTIWGQGFDGSGNVDGDFTQTKLGSYGGSGSFFIYNKVTSDVPSRAGAFRWVFDNYSYFSCLDILNIDGDATSAIASFRASGNVGIGTTSPSYKLHVNGSLNATTIYQNGTSINSLLGNYLPLSGGTLSGNLTIGTTATTANHEIGVYRNANKAAIGVSIDCAYLGLYGSDGSTGAVYVNSTKLQYLKGSTWYDIWHSGNLNFNPSNYLPLSFTTLQTITGGNLSLPITIKTSSTHNHITFYATGADAEKAAFIGVISDPKISGGSAVFGSDGGRIIIPYSGGMYYQTTYNSTPYRIWHEGNFNPSNYLPLTGGTLTGALSISTSGTYQLTTISSQTTGWISGVNITAPSMTSGAHVNITFGKTDSAKNRAWVGYYHSANGSNDNRLCMGLHNVDDVFNITGAANVGIGTTSPSAKLEVAGDVIIQDNISVLENSGHFSGINFWYGNRTRNYHLSARGGETNKNFRLYWYNGTNYNPLIDVTESGNVGIGTTSPAYKLEVNGDIKFLNKLVWADTTNYYIGARSNSAFEYVNWYGHYFKSAGTDRMCITRDGLVGIGTIGPAHTLDVNGNIGCGNIYHSDGVIYLTMGVSGNYRYVNVGQYNNSTYSTFLNLNASLATRWISAAGSEIVRIDHSNGYVGIGTTSPSYKLHVNGNAKIVNALWLDDAILFGSQHQIKKDTSGIFMYNSVATSFIELYDNKNITLSTGANEANINISTTADKITSLNFLNSNVVNWQISSRTSSQDKGLRIYSYDGTSWLATMTILKSGNIGIDTTSPAYKLDVNGSFSCSTFYIGNDQITFIT